MNNLPGTPIQLEKQNLYSQPIKWITQLKPLVGKSPHHINTTQNFIEQVKHITLAPGECLSSYDVSALFTSVPVDPALTS